VDDELNLELDIDELGLHGSGEHVARIKVMSARGFTRSGAAPTITDDCTSYRAFEAEVNRLQGELTAALTRAADYFEASRVERTEARVERHSEETSARGDKPHLPAELTVGQVMTRDVRTLGENDELAMAEELMKVGRFRHVVVLDEQGKVSGVVSHRDIFFSTIAWCTGLGQFAHDKALHTFAVKQVMHNSPQTITPDADLADAAVLMMEHKIGCLPVIEGEALVGVLTEGDFLSLIV
jgi:CBS domain-containing protein